MARENNVQESADRGEELLRGNTTAQAFSLAYQKAETSEKKLLILNSWRSEYPDDFAPWFLSGQMETEQGRLDAAISSYAAALRLSPNDIGTLGRLGDIHFQRGEYVHSFLYYERLLELEEPPVWAMIGAGNTFERLGFSELTLLLFLHALALEPLLHPVLYERTISLFDKSSSKNRERYAAAISSLIDKASLCRGLDSTSLKRIAKIRKFSNALSTRVRDIPTTAKPGSKATADKLPTLRDAWKEWKVKIESSLMKNLTINIIGIANRHLQAVITGLPDERLIAALYVDGYAHDELVFVRTNGRKIGPNSLTAEYKLSPDLVNARPHAYVIRLQVGEFRFHSDPLVISAPDYALGLDSLTDGKLLGWALVKDDATVPDLRVRCEQGLAVEVETNLERLDVSAVFAGAPRRTGFSVTLPRVPSDGLTLLLEDARTGICISRVSIASQYDLMRQAVSEWAFHTSRLHRSLLRTAASDALNRANGALSFVYEHLPTVPPVASHSEVAVIIPVYDGLESTIDCVESVLTSENQALRKVIIIDDCSPNQAIQAYLRDLEQQQLHDVVIIRRRTNGGFSEAVNLGIVAAQDRDVILLNSDTLVQNGWIDRLRAAAQSDSNIGTVTPLSNNAEITNVPYICRPMPMSDSALALRVDEKASEVNSRQIVDIPVAVGFCVYVKRSCIDEVGLFDSKTWGRGYGEEVDFCLKAVARGWRHVLALDTFVLHHGAISFGDEKKARIAESTKEINKRYPFYDAVIKRFIRDDPARAARRKLNLSLIGAEISNRRVLHVTHGYGGGTNQYVSDQCEIERLDGWASMVLTFSASGEAHLSCTHSSSLLQGFLADNHVESYAQDELDSIKEDIHSLKISRVHLHSPFGLPLHFMDWLVRTYPTTITVHDYAWICPRVHLTQGSDRYCGEPNIEGCNQCVRIHGVHKDLQSFVENVGEDVALYRQAFQEILRKAEVVLTGAQDVVSRMERHGVTAKFKVLPYSHPPDSVFLKRANHDYPVQKGEAIRVALIGGISHGKGLGQLLRCADYASKNDLGVNFIIFGSTSDDAAVTNHRNITIVGAYTEEDLEALISRHRPHVAFFPYQWPETYSYTLSHAIRLNMRIVVTNIGAPAERVRDVPNATVISLTAEPKEMIEHLIQVARTGQSSKQV